MDYQAQTPSVHDYTESPPKFGKPKERSQFKFDKNYLNVFSNTPVIIFYKKYNKKEKYRFRKNWKVHDKNWRKIEI
jgi:hypothetical protein